MRYAIVLGALLLSTLFCPCRNVPTADATPPGASLVVEYRVPGGIRESRTFGVGDSPVTLAADAGDTIDVLYIGNDAEGLRFVHLDYDMSRSTGTGVQSPLLVEKKVGGRCPQQTLTGAETFDPGGLNWRYEFSTRSEAWLGNQAATPMITVQAQ